MPKFTCTLDWQRVYGHNCGISRGSGF